MTEITIRPVDPDHPAAWECLAAYSRFLAEKIPEEGPEPIPLPLTDADGYRPPQGTILVAFVGDEALGCVCLHALSPGLGEVKRLWIVPQARGTGLSRRLMSAVEDHARTLGMTRLNLDTNERLQNAIALYASLGWTPTAPYTAFPATHWFTKAL